MYSSSIGAVAHTHSVASTVLSRRHVVRGALRLRGYEMAKALSGVRSHETEIALPILPSTQDMMSLARTAATKITDGVYGYLVEGHGLTTWAADVGTLRRHVEALEFLLACALHEG
jgi:methylthioribulose-1-phosphate dehydratase